MEIVKIRKIFEDSKIPVRATNESACWDIFAHRIIEDNDTIIVYTGVAITPPVGYKIVLVPRSSIVNTNLIQQNSPGQGDRDYTGEYKFVFRKLHGSNVNYGRSIYNVGDRIGQIYIEGVIEIEFKEVDNLEDTERGSGGFS